MRILNLMAVVTLATLLSACHPTQVRALPGTDTVLVGVYLDKDGAPHETNGEIIVHPGQKVFYAGPVNFTLVFKDQKTPNGKVENASIDGVITVAIPDDIFERKEFADEFRKNDFLIFDYVIRVNGRTLDPPMKIVRR